MKNRTVQTIGFVTLEVFAGISIIIGILGFFGFSGLIGNNVMFKCISITLSIMVAGFFTLITAKGFEK